MFTMSSSSESIAPFWPPSHSTTAFSPCAPDVMNGS